jgi:hypothetical protein
MPRSYVLDAVAGEALRGWFELWLGIPVFWLDQPESYRPDDYAVLALGSSTRMGQDGVRWARDATKPPGMEMIPTVVGQREFALTVEIRSWSQDLDSVAEADLAPLEAALQLPSAQQLLVTHNLGLVDTSPIRQTDELVDDRRQSRAAIDITFATSIQVTDADDGQSYIETAEVTTVLSGGPRGDVVIAQVVPELDEQEPTP